MRPLLVTTVNTDGRGLQPSALGVRKVPAGIIGRDFHSLQHSKIPGARRGWITQSERKSIVTSLSAEPVNR